MNSGYQVIKGTANSDDNSGPAVAPKKGAHASDDSRPDAEDQGERQRSRDFRDGDAKRKKIIRATT